MIDKYFTLQQYGVYILPTDLIPGFKIHHLTTVDRVLPDTEDTTYEPSELQVYLIERLDESLTLKDFQDSLVDWAVRESLGLISETDYLSQIVDELYPDKPYLAIYLDILGSLNQDLLKEILTKLKELPDPYNEYSLLLEDYELESPLYPLYFEISFPNI